MSDDVFFPSGPARRKGFVIPVAVLVLVIFAIVGIASIFSGTGDYTQTAYIYYGTKADFVARAVHEEVQAVMYDLFERPLSIDGTKGGISGGDMEAKFRKELLSAVRSALGSGKVTGDIDKVVLEFHKDLNNYLPQSARLARDARVTIKTAAVKFYGFRRMKYQAEGFWQRDDTYYRDTFDILDKPGKVKAPRDYIGYYQVLVQTVCRGRKREHYYNHDMKIVSVAPVAREFALFSYGQTMSQASNGGPMQYVTPLTEDYVRGDLNRGGGLKVFGYGWGRIFVRGPFFFDVQGKPKGEGGPAVWQKEQGDPMANTFPRTKKEGGKRRRWWGWSLLPAPRAPTLDKFTFGSHEWPARPDVVKGHVRGAVTEFVTEAPAVIWDAFSEFDPAEFIEGWEENDPNDEKDDTGQRWICAAVEAKEPEKAFSIIGDPYAGKDDQHRFVMFRGIKWVGEKSDPNDEDSPLELKPKEPYWPDPQVGWYVLDEPDSSEDVRMSIRPEGMLMGNYRVSGMVMTGAGFWDTVKDWFVEDYELKTIPKDEKAYYAGYLGLNWEQLHTIHWAEKLLKGVGLLALGPLSLGALGSMRLLTRFTAPFAKRAVMGASAAVLSGSAIATAVISPGGNMDFGNADLSNIKWVFAPNYRLLARAAVRKYHRLDNIIPKGPSLLESGDNPTPQNPLLLDGVIWCDDLSTSTGMFYRGRGMVVSEGVSEELNPEEDHKIKLPVVPSSFDSSQRSDEVDLDTVWKDRDDFLTLGLLRWAPGHFHEGKRQIVFDADEDWTACVASVISEMGVRPVENRKVDIIGNLVCHFPNKHRIPDTSTLAVRYNKRMYPEGENSGKPSNGLPPAAPEFEPSDDGSDWCWYSFACSRKLTGISEGLRDR